jgi:parvulin-like peptidyl-prolyl isomerase
VPPFPEIKDKVVEAVKRERAQVAAEERAKSLAGAVGTGDLFAAARREKLSAGEIPIFSRAEPPKGESLPGAVLMAALQTPTGKLSDPVKTGAGVYLVRTLERRPADPQGFDKVREQLRTQVLDQKRASAWERWVKTLYAGAKIKIQGETVAVD